MYWLEEAGNSLAHLVQGHRSTDTAARSITVSSCGCADATLLLVIEPNHSPLHRGLL
jgi:hypothetical protein